MKKELSIIIVFLVVIGLFIYFSSKPKIITITNTKEYCSVTDPEGELLRRTQTEWMQEAEKACPNGILSYKLDYLDKYSYGRPNFTCK